MVSERSRLQWETCVAARQARTTTFSDRDELHRFLVGIHIRGEQLIAPELGHMLEATGADDAERDTLAAFVEDGLALPLAYDNLMEAEDEAYSDGVHGGYQI